MGTTRLVRDTRVMRLDLVIDDADVVAVTSSRTPQYDTIGLA